MARVTALIARWSLALAAVLYAAAARAAEDLAGRGAEQYQGRSLENFGRGSAGLWSTVRQFAADLHVTPARALVGAGLVGALYTLNKNKRLFRWGVLAAISYALLAAGALALYKGWPSLN